MDDSKENLLVTGSSGLIGTALIDALQDRYNVIAFDLPGPPHPPDHADRVAVDLSSDESVQNALTHVRLDYGRRLASVVHLAAYVDFSGAPSGMYDAVTVDGTERLLRELEAFEVGQVLYSSTMLVHAPGRGLTESSPLQPKWPYPQSKLKTETLLREKHGAVPLLILRIAGVYSDRCDSIPLAQQMRRIYERRLIGGVFPGDPSHGQSFVHLADVVDALLLGIQKRAALPAEETLLVGEAEAVPYAELQKEFGRLIHGREWPAWPIPKPVAKVGAWIQDRFGNPFIKPWMIDLADDHYELDIARARDVLGWEPRRSLRRTLPSMVGALMTDPIGWYRAHGLPLPWRLARRVG